MCIENEPPKRNSLTIKGFVKLSYLTLITSYHNVESGRPKGPEGDQKRPRGPESQQGQGARGLG